MSLTLPNGAIISIANGYGPVTPISALTNAAPPIATATYGTLAAPVANTPTTSTTGGTLAATTYYYKVTALNSNGETVGSNEVSILTTGATSSNVITWAAVVGATSYRVYRGTAAAGENVYYAPGNVTTFTDTGGTSSAGSPPGSNTATTNLNTGDIFEITSGWSRFGNKIARATAVSGNNFGFENLDSTLTNIYSPGNGTGSVRKITGWTQLQQIVNSQSSGGDQQFLTYQLLEADRQQIIPTIKNPFDMTLEIADDPSLAGYLVASAANDDRLPRAVKIALANGSFLYHNCYISLNRIPSMTVNTLMSCQVKMAMLNEPVRYAF